MFDVPEQYDVTEYHLRPSLLASGYANVVLSIIDHLLPKEPEKPKPGSFLRTLCGYVWEADYYINQFEAGVVIQPQVPLVYQHTRADIYGTCDFIETTDDTITIVDTKCVATKVAEQLKQGYEGLGYHDQLRWYMEMLKDNATVTGYKSIEHIGLFGQLAVLDRNYLNFDSYIVQPWTHAEFTKQLKLVDKYVDLMLACQERDEAYVMDTLTKAFNYVQQSGVIHPYAQYQNYGNCFKWSYGAVTETKPRITAKYFESVRTAIADSTHRYTLRKPTAET
jgi:hypothetical protein